MVKGILLWCSTDEAEDITRTKQIFVILNGIKIKGEVSIEQKLA